MGRPGPKFVPELDVFRGWAAVLMIVNHAGYALLSPANADAGASGLAVFVGSFAPVLFFFATGFGIGLKRVGQPPSSLLDTAWKSILLIAADQAMYWRGGASFGFDFFSFIGVASLLVVLVARARRPVHLSLFLVVAILVVRYAVGPFVREWLPEQGWSDWLTGLRGHTGVSYPFAPWMVYPLIGFVLGRWYGDEDAAAQQRRWLLAGAAICVASLALTSAMLWMGAHLFRWGSMSSSFFSLSLGVLAAFAMLSVATARSASAGRLFALRGVASFAVIPIHYALLGLAERFDLPLPPWGFAVAALGLIVLSWIGAAALARFAEGPWLTEQRRFALPALVGLLAALLVATVAGPHGPSAWMTASALGAQLTIACLLGLRAKRGGGSAAKLRAARV